MSPLLQSKYYSSGANVLINDRKILDIAKKDFFWLKFSHIDKQRW